MTLTRRSSALTGWLTLVCAVQLSGVACLWAGEPTEPVSFGHARVTESWKAYADVLTFGRGQTLALVDDGCKLSMPEWTTPFDGKPKVDRKSVV